MRPEVCSMSAVLAYFSICCDIWSFTKRQPESSSCFCSSLWKSLQNVRFSFSFYTQSNLVNITGSLFADEGSCQCYVTLAINDKARIDYFTHFHYFWQPFRLELDMTNRQRFCWKCNLFLPLSSLLLIHNIAFVCIFVSHISILLFNILVNYDRFLFFHHTFNYFLYLSVCIKIFTLYLVLENSNITFPFWADTIVCSCWSSYYQLVF